MISKKKTNFRHQFCEFIILVLVTLLLIGCQHTVIWTRKADMPTARFSPACVIKGKIYAIGGALTVKPPHPAVSTVEVFKP